MNTGNFAANHANERRINCVEGSVTQRGLIICGTGFKPVSARQKRGLEAHATKPQPGFHVEFTSCLIRVISGLCLLLLIATAAAAQTTQPRTRFLAIDVNIDPQGQSLAAYQVDFRALSGDVKLVGVEGGAPGAFAAAPYYDAKALQQSRIIIAAFSTDTALPTTKTRVARLHVQIAGDAIPDYQIKLIVAGNRDSKPIDATATFEPYQN